ncbi:MAG: alpha/beta hydrolase family protein [Pirellulaceae bacterium]|jgi:dienelactone hydrolase|nr:alpha/beta hydrolase family protein [Pirellulaceae bacterium]MDP7016286.1 alpha/beta hydrolase family protein [Pirellulaceae bacterium]
MNAARISILAVVTLLMSASLAAANDLTDVYADGQRPEDSRLEDLIDLNGYFPFHPPKTKAEWRQRSAELRQRVRVATGLWPEPPKTPLKPVIFGRVERDGFTVERAYFESIPGHYVTGLLFRPEGDGTKRPAVLCPHGHGGRLQDYGEKAMAKLIEQGAEKHKASGRFPKLARCAQLARMGCVVYIYDMLGYADSVQIDYQLSHRFAKQRPELNTKDKWGFYSTQAELRLQSIMGLQTWNSVRALDFLCSLPDVDSKRVGVTGGSGGGTQTILLGALDERPVVAFPNGMVSTSMQGGCTCENCSLLRVGTGNVELAALFAPRPQGMTAANDWTRGMMTKGFPQLQQLYKTLGKPDDVMCEAILHFPHNYNYVTRAFMYSWFNKHLELGLKEPIIEEDFRPLTPAEWTVWDDKLPKPTGGVEHELQVIRYLTAISKTQMNQVKPFGDEKQQRRFRDVVGPAIETIIGRTLKQVGPIEREKVHKDAVGDALVMRDILRIADHGEELPIVSLYPTTTKWNGQAVLWFDGAGKQGLFDKKGAVIADVQKLLDAGAAVIGADVFQTGEFTADGKPAAKNRIVGNPREFAGYTFTYNDTLFAQRTHDVLSLLSFVVNDEHKPEKIDLVGVNGAGPWVAAAAAVARDAKIRVAVVTKGFRFVDVGDYRDANFLTGAVKYGDLPAILALSAPRELYVGGETTNDMKMVLSAYGSPFGDQAAMIRKDETTASVAAWLLD